MSLLTNERYKTYKMGVSFSRLGHAPGWDLGGKGVKKYNFSKIQQNLVCELLTLMAHATVQFIGSPPTGALGRGQKVKYYLISITKTI